MDLVQRAKNIILTPKTEWPVIAAETMSTADLVTGYVLPLAAIDAVAGFIGSTLIGTMFAFLGATIRLPIITALMGACVGLIVAIVSIFVLSIIISALAPTFGGQPNNAQAMKVAAFSYTAAWVGGIARVVPVLGSLVALVGALYSLYLLYLGLPVLMKNPPDKSAGYTVVVVLCAIVLGVVVSVIFGIIVGVGALGAGMFGGF